MNMENAAEAESSESTSLSEAYREAIAISSEGRDPTKSIKLLTTLQERIASAALFSSNDTLEDVPTSLLPFLAVEFHLATTLSSAPTPSLADRQANVRRCRELCYGFLRKLDELEGLLDEDSTRDYRQLLEAEEKEEEGRNTLPGTTSSRSTGMTPAQIREAKIARFRARKVQREEVERLEALWERRNRLGVTDEDEVDGYDGDGLDRNLALAELRGYAADALDEIQSTRKELDMLDMAVRMERERGEMGRHRGIVGEAGRGGGTGIGGAPQPPVPPRPNSRHNKPMEVTRVTKDPATGQLQLKREEIQSSVFRPGWNQPTMTLSEYGDMEVARAKEREANQKQTEMENMNKPRRYEQLVKDGMEDDANLVDASAKLDREWDDWKATNPRGSGNKMGDVGDRNF